MSPVAFSSQLLTQLDGFDERSEVKVIMATNKIESLDPALIRPGRIDRKIEFPLPDVTTKVREREATTRNLNGATSFSRHTSLVADALSLPTTVLA